VGFLRWTTPAGDLLAGAILIVVIVVVAIISLLRLRAKAKACGCCGKCLEGLPCALTVTSFK